ncbi:MAG: hypothetical protein ACE37J_07230 [Pikeienuella sp.]|uniref:hypothetical protein n=1 Tax=Pikeienuella sp. TaxID=2831957 RepID=UPI003918C2E8
MKFKAVPGKQFPVRRELPHLIRAAREQAGIRFASREVAVGGQEYVSPAERRSAIGAAASRELEEAERA